MTDHVTSTGRTFSTSIIQREVIHAQGHRGSNQNSAVLRSDMAPSCHPVDRTSGSRDPRDRMVRRPGGARPAPRPAPPRKETPCPARTSPVRRPPPARPSSPSTATTSQLDVATGPETFSTTSTIPSAAPGPGAETFLDFVGGTVEAVTVNGVDLDPAEHYADSRVRLPGLAAENVVVVAATGRYTNTGEGLHRFVDPVDDEVYLYSQFEVPDSRRMYPVFEQPDLKARFTFTVTAPAHWQVVSNSPTPQPEPAGDGVATWHFAPTGPISSYITALVAGPVRRGARHRQRAGAARCRSASSAAASLTPYLDADNLFDLTKRGFAFFEEEFDCAYPFEKYDQLFAPEYNMGAMENAGCVTINEMYVFRSKVTERRVERRALTVLHELAHMWFGDLVTMRWWNDLWLNESFAEWASTPASPRPPAGPTPGPPSARTRRTGRTARTSSARPTRSWPRSATCEDVEVNFDGITYAKGASVLKQLVAYVGLSRSATALRAYFAQARLGQHHARRPARRARGDLRARPATWSKQWLETAGVSTLRPVLEVDDRGRIASAVRRADLRARGRDAAPAHPRDRPVRRARRPAGAHRPPRARRRRRAHPGARAGRARAARPAARQRRRPRLREDPARRALAGHRPAATRAASPRRCPARWCWPRCGT